MNEIKIPQFSYYNQKGELVVKGGYTIHRDEDPYILGLLDQYSAGSFSADLNIVKKQEISSVEDLVAILAEDKKANVVLKNNLSISDTFDIPQGSMVNLDLGGYTITVEKSNFTNSGNLILKNGTVTGIDEKEGRRAIINNETGDLSLINVSVKQVYAGGGAAIVNSGKMTIESGNIEAANMAISNKNGAKAVINGGTFIGNGTGQSYAICNQFDSEMIINDGNFTGGHGCIANTGKSKMTVYGGSFGVTGKNSFYVLYCSGEGNGEAHIEYKTNNVELRSEGAKKVIYCDTDGSTVVEI